MARYVVVKSVVQLLGKIWMPPVTCGYETTLSDYDVENMRNSEGVITRESAEQWIILNSGDFQSIEDWRADISLADGTDIMFEWANEESEHTYWQCMYGEE